MQQAMVLDIVPLPMKVVRSGMTWRVRCRCRPSATPPPAQLRRVAGIGDRAPIQARLALTDIMSPDR